jgi:hypothetical protein
MFREKYGTILLAGKRLAQMECAIDNLSFPCPPEVTHGPKPILV